MAVFVLFRCNKEYMKSVLISLDFVLFLLDEEDTRNYNLKLYKLMT